MIRLAVRVAQEHAEVVLAELIELAPSGVEEVDLDDGRVEYAVYGPPGEVPALPELRALAGGAAVEIATSEVADDWHERWKAFHRPVAIDPPRRGGVPGLRVRPPWEPPLADPPPETIELVVDPGQAFGTGAHASTRLCLSLLLELAAAEGAERAVLDVGTGSGVLAIAAARLGFSPLLGLDNEPESISAARENALANGVSLPVERFDLRSEALPWLGSDGAARTASPAGSTVVLANLLRPLLVELAGALRRRPAALIAGGLLVAELDEAAAAFSERAGLVERERRVEGEWGALWLAAPH